MSGKLPVVAIVGAPNVGKSTLFNRILGRRQAVVADEPGTTRDRNYNLAEWSGREFELVDTGGMEPDARVGLEALVTLQAEVAAGEAKIIIHLVDSRTGPSEADAAIARTLRGGSARVILAVNKLDNPADDTEKYVFYSLGEGDPHGISAAHGIGIGDLLDQVIELLPDTGVEADAGLPAIAIIGRPNVGKSTLLNSLLGKDRAVVSEVAGTTTDVVAGEVEAGEQRFALLDTAGINRRSRRAQGVPYYAGLKTEAAIRRADVSLLVLDAVEGLTAEDMRIARKVEEAGRSCGVLVNKSDLVCQENLEEISDNISARMTDLRPPVISVSGLTGSGEKNILPLAGRLYKAYNLRIPTPDVARFISDIASRNSPPGGVKIRYALQTGSAPPRFTLFANRPKELTDTYMRYIENSLRRRYGLEGVSVRLRARSSH